MEIYSDLINEFMLLDYSRSHTQLLIRSKKNKYKEYNTDIIFKGVYFISMPSLINGIAISVIDPGVIADYVEIFGLKNDQGYKIFSLSNTKQQYFINASSFGVFQNKLDILETSLGRYDMGTIGEEILWFKG